MSTSANRASQSVPNRVATGGFIVAFILAGFCVPFVSLFGFGAAAALRVVGPPLDVDAPHNGQVVAHIDVLGKFPPDLARIRVTEVATGATIWDVKPTTPRAECWNRCWNLTLKAGSNPAAFAAGDQQFNASVPHGASFSLLRGTAYRFEVWDSRGRVERDRFTL